MKHLLRGLTILLSICGTAFPLFANKTPSSKRSKKAIQAVRPILKKEFSQKGFRWGAAIFIRIIKKDKILEMWVQKDEQFQLFKQYEICTFGAFSRLGPKLKQGDSMAPEGFYFVQANQLNPYSSYHLSFNLGYPNRYDRAHRRTGSALMVHGDCVSIGCYAMGDKQIEEIYTIVDAALRHGQPFFRVHIFPFQMTSSNMKKYKVHQWYSFWKNLKEGYDYFEQHKRPPNVLVRNKSYYFE